MSIRIDLTDDGQIEIYDTESKRWQVFKDVRQAMRVISRRLHKEVDALQKNLGIQQRT